MAQVKEVKVPDIGDFDKVDVIEVLVKAGDSVAVDDPLVSLESDKATMDIPSPSAGTVKELKVKAGDSVSQGTLILTLEAAEGAEGVEGAPTKGEAKKEKAPQAKPEAKEAKEKETAEEGATANEAQGESATGKAERQAPAAPAKPPEAPTPTQAVATPAGEGSFKKAHASPAVRRFARELGVELTRVEGSGRKGRITKTDVQDFVKRSLSGSGSTPGAGGGGLPPMPQVDFAKFGEIETLPMSRIQKVSAKNLHRSWLHVPHVTQHEEADITEMDAFRRAHADEAKARGFKLTPVAFLIKAAVAALTRHPRLNSSLGPDGESVILKKYFHIGVAVDTEEGLMVPVLRNADQKSLYQLAEELGDLSTRARERKLKLDELQGASFTITSLGGIGGTAFTPIVNAPEVAILGVSRASLRPVWRDGDFEPRLILPLSLSYDHRVVDGALAARFVTTLAWVLGDLRRMLL